MIQYYKNKKVVVTGGAGFIGSELSRQLAHVASRVEIIDNLVNGKLENIKDILSDNVIFHNTDIRDVVEMRRIFIDADVVFHLATLGVRHSIHSPYENHEVNSEASLRLLMLAKELEVSKFVYVSTSEVYGTATSVPMKESHPTMPMTVYGASKLSGECYARAFWRTYNYPTVIVRPFNSYGPRSHHEGDSGEVIPKFMLRTLAGKSMVVFGDGTQTRDFTFVSDTANGMMLAGAEDCAIGNTFNLGQGNEMSIMELAETIRKVTNKPKAKVEHIENRPGDVLRLYSDTSFANDKLGFTPSVNLEDGLRKLLQWYMDSGLKPEELLQNENVRNWQGK